MVGKGLISLVPRHWLLGKSNSTPTTNAWALGYYKPLPDTHCMHPKSAKRNKVTFNPDSHIHVYTYIYMYVMYFSE